MSKPTRLVNPYVDADIKHQVSFGISEEAFEYFDRKLALRHGWTSAVFGTFMQKLHAHCMAENIHLQPKLDFDDDIVTVMSNLNFNEKPAVTRRSANRTTVNKKQPKGS